MPLIAENSGGVHFLSLFCPRFHRKLDELLGILHVHPGGLPVFPHAPAGIQHLACQGIAFSGTEHRDDHALGINHFRPGLGTAAGDGVPRGAEQQALSGGASTVLSTATDGYHYHLVEAATPDRLDLIGQALQDAGFLAPLQPWEKEK